MTVKVWHLHPLQEIFDLCTGNNKIKQGQLQVTTRNKRSGLKRTLDSKEKPKIKLIPYFPIIRYVNCYSNITIITVDSIKMAFEHTEIF